MFVPIAKGLTTTIAQRNRNVPVQDFYLRLDFSGTTMGARLSVGDYIAVHLTNIQSSIFTADRASGVP